MSPLSEQELHVLQHALGVDEYGRGNQYRCHYVAGPGHHSFDACEALVAKGFMSKRAPSELSGGDPVFIVTQAGHVAMCEASPPPPSPKLTCGG